MTQPHDPFAQGPQPLPRPTPPPVGRPLPPGYRQPGAPGSAFAYTLPASTAVGGGFDVAPQGSVRSRRSGKKKAVIAAGVVGAVLIGGTAYASVTYLSGAGTQPEDVLPGSTVAFAKVDLDPAANQKTAVLSLMNKFPDVSASDANNLKDNLLRPLFAEGDVDGLAYDTDVAPWIGNRAAVAGAPGADGQITALFAVQFTDQEKMENTLDRLLAQQQSEPGSVDSPPASEPFGYAVRDDYVLISETQADADAAAAASSVLADDSDYITDLGSLNGDQIAVAWVDVGAAYQAVPASELGDLSDLTGGITPQGRIVVGLHAENDALEVQGKINGFPESALNGTVSDQPSTLIKDLPASTIAAAALTGVGDLTTQAWDQYAADGTDPLGILGEIDESGLVFPDDLQAIFGQDLVIAAFGDMNAPAFGVRVSTDDPARAVDLLTSITADQPVAVSGTSDGYIVASDGVAADALATDGTLGDSKPFQRAVPNADASAVGYVNVGVLVDQIIAEGTENTEDAAEAAKWKALDSVGFSADRTGFTVRITTR